MTETPLTDAAREELFDEDDAERVYNLLDEADKDNIDTAVMLLLVGLPERRPEFGRRQALLVLILLTETNAFKALVQPHKEPK